MDLVAPVRMVSVSIETLLVVVVVSLFAGVFIVMALLPVTNIRQGFISCPPNQCANSQGTCGVC